MRTTVRLNNVLFERAKCEASRRNITFTQLVEEGLLLALTRNAPTDDRVPVSLPVSAARGGMLPGVDLDDTSAILDAMEARR